MNAYYGKMLFYKMSEFAIIIHCDETFAPYENVEKRTLERSNAKKVRIRTTGQEKEGCTVLLGGIYVKRTERSHRLPPLFIFKCESSGVRILPDIEATAERLNCYATLTEKGWMNDKTFLWYIEEIVDNWLLGKRFGVRLERLKVHAQPGDTKALVMDVHDRPCCQQAPRDRQPFKNKITFLKHFLVSKTLI